MIRHESPNANYDIWQIVATTPSIVAAEQLCAAFRKQEAEAQGLQHRLEDYYWNSGVPYVREAGAPQPDATQNSFNDDVLGEPLIVGNPNISPKDRLTARYRNDPLIEFQSTTPVEGLDVRIGHGADDKYYLVGEDGRVISKGYSSLQHRGGDIFEIPGLRHPGTLTLLNKERRREVRQERDLLEHFYRCAPDRNRRKAELSEQIAKDTLQAHGIPAENVDTRRDNDVALRFNYNGKLILIGMTDRNIRVVVKDIATENSEENTGLLHFEIESPYPSWSIPAALSIANMPQQEAYQLLTNSEHFVNVPQPGIIELSNGEPFRITPEGTAERLPPHAGGQIADILSCIDYPTDQRVAAVVQLLKEGKSPAWEALNGESPADKGTRGETSDDQMSSIIRWIINTL